MTYVSLIGMLALVGYLKYRHTRGAEGRNREVVVELAQGLLGGAGPLPVQDGTYFVDTRRLLNDTPPRVPRSPGPRVRDVDSGLAGRGRPLPRIPVCPEGLLSVAARPPAPPETRVESVVSSDRPTRNWTIAAVALAGFLSLAACKDSPTGSDMAPDRAVPETAIPTAQYSSCPHSHLEGCNALDFEVIADILEALEAEIAKLPGGPGGACQEAVDALWQILHPDGLYYGELYSFDDAPGYSPSTAALSPPGGDFVALRAGHSAFFGSLGFTEHGLGILFHEGLHLAGYEHGTLDGYTSTSTHCTGGQRVA